MTLFAFIYMDYWYVVLVLPAFLLSLIIQMRLRSVYSKYSKIAARSGLTGAGIAQQVLSDNGVSGVSVEMIEGELTDHYDPKAGRIRLSRAVYAGNSVAALGVAAHEAGHAVQHSRTYMPLMVRNAIVPVVNFSAGISWWVFLIGLFMEMTPLAYVGIALFSFATLFHLVTLPVELDASRRAIHALESCGALDDGEIRGTRRVLSAAAMTYVAALVTSLASLLRMIMLVQGRRRN